MDYIREMRSLVGTRPLLLPGTLVIVVDELDRILLTRRVDTGEWSLPGGHMEPGETITQTGRREVREEVGIDVGEMTLVGIFSGPDYYYKYPNGDEIYKVTVVYSAPWLPGELRLDRAEVSGAEFFALDEIPGNVIAHEVPIIERYANAAPGCACARTSG
jgi:8-oxo-dGTP pyrophosphatase MutT (NUDIX family)